MYDKMQQRNIVILFCSQLPRHAATCLLWTLGDKNCNLKTDMLSKTGLHPWRIHRSCRLGSIQTLLHVRM